LHVNLDIHVLLPSLQSLCHKASTTKISAQEEINTMQKQHLRGCRKVSAQACWQVEKTSIIIEILSHF
jgi:hypothetical protein